MLGLSGAEPSFPAALLAHTLRPSSASLSTPTPTPTPTPPHDSRTVGMDAIKRALGGTGAGGAATQGGAKLESADYASLLPREQALLQARKNQPSTKTKLACTVGRA
jgi:hypothetical protein